MSEQTCYQLLQITSSATEDEIKTAYRKLAIQYHPDKNEHDHNAADRFMAITKAYETLKDGEKRRAYDIELTKPKPTLKSSSQTTAPSSDAFKNINEALRIFMNALHAESSFSNFSEQNNGESLRGEDKKITISLTLQEINRGCQKMVKLKHNKKCSICSGTGSTEQKASLIDCHQCNGLKQVRLQGHAQPISCPKCKGTGKIPKHGCTTCNGFGYVSGESIVDVSFKAGIAEGNYITFSGMGDCGIRGAPSGDLFVFIKEECGTDFKRNGADIEIECEIPALTATIGGKTQVRNVNGQIKTITIPVGTQPGTLFCIKGFGLPKYKEQGNGDFYARIQIKIPDHLSEKELALYKQIADFQEQQPYRQIGEFCIIDIDPVDGMKAWQDVFKTASVLIDSDMKIALNFIHVSFIDSMGLGGLISLARKIIDKKQVFYLINVSDNVRESFESCNIEMLFAFVNDEHVLLTGM